MRLDAALQVSPGCCGAGPGVFVASDVALVREGLCLQLARSSELQLRGAGQPDDELLAGLCADPPDVLILDFGSRHSCDFVQRLRLAQVKVRVVGIAIGKSPLEVADWAKLGVAGFVDDDGGIDDVIHAVRLVARGEFCSSPTTTARLVSGLVSAPRPPSDPTCLRGLTARETQIIFELERGISNKEIARRLGISAATVKNHIHSVLTKLELSRRQQVASLLRSRNP